MTTSHTNPPPIRLYWSCTPAPAGIRMAWSARAIYLPSKCNVWKDDKRIPPKAGMDEALEFLPDRQAFVGPDGKELPETEEHDHLTVFADCIDEEIIPALLDELSRTTPSGDSYGKIELSSKNSYPWTLVATPNGSYGYMYVSVWLMPEEEIEDEDDGEAMQQGMGLGIDAYNEARGMDTSNPENDNE